MVKTLRGETYFRPGEWFSIVRHAEGIKDRHLYHDHDFLEICYVLAGSGFHMVGETEYRVGRGDLFIINHGMRHGFYRGGADQELITYNLLFKPGFLDESLLPFDDFSSLTLSYLFRDISGDEPIREDLRLAVWDQQEMEEILSEIMQEYETRLPGYQAVIRAHLTRFIVKIMRFFHRKSESEPDRQRNLALIESAIRHLNTYDFHEKIDIAELARRSFFSKNYFARLFKETTGTTIYQYIQHIRIEQACRWIRETDKTMSEIALELGFSDYKTFYAAFRKQKGLSPQAFRDELLSSP